MDVDALLASGDSTAGRRLVRIEAKLDQLLAPPVAPLVGKDEAMTMTGTKSARSLYRELRRLNVHRVGRAKWRRQDITNAQQRQILESQIKRK